MRFRIDPTNPRTFRRMVREGRGSGRGEEYKPWLTVRDLSSKGESSRMQGWRTGKRLVHLFSRLERNFLYSVEWDRSVVDYREQFPLDLAVTCAIADELGIDHPVSPDTGRFWPMTTDLLVTRMVNGETVDYARSVKPFNGVELQDSAHPRHVKNNWRKFRIEFEYWKRNGVQLAWVTEKDISPVLVRNVREVHGFFHVESLHPLTQPDVDRISAEMFCRVNKGGESLAKIGIAVDAQFGLKPGMSIRVAQHEIACGNWNVDFSVPFRSNEPLTLCQNSN
jgi:hypothetical protein